MPKYSMPFIAKIYRFLKVCLEINDLEINNAHNQNYTYNYTQNSCKIFYNSPNLYKIEIEKLNHSTDILLRYIYQKSIKENFYFFDCPAPVYIKHYECRKKNFLNQFIDSEEKDFVVAELHNLQNPDKFQMLCIKYKCINKFLAKKNKELINFDHLRNNQNSGATLIQFNKKSATINYSQLIITDQTWKFSYLKKIEFLESKLQELTAMKTKVIKTVEEEDFNHKDNLTINQTVILLDNFGFFSSLNFNDVSKNKQSDLAGLIMRRNAKNIKIALEKLNKKPSENGVKYQSDISKIDKLINNLKK